MIHIEKSELEVAHPDKDIQVFHYGEKLVTPGLHLRHDLRFLGHTIPHFVVLHHSTEGTSGRTTALSTWNKFDFRETLNSHIFAGRTSFTEYSTCGILLCRFLGGSS